MHPKLENTNVLVVWIEATCPPGLKTFLRFYTLIRYSLPGLFHMWKLGYQANRPPEAAHVSPSSEG